MSRTVALAAVAALSTSFLAGCGGGGGGGGDGGSTTTSATTFSTTTTAAVDGFNCATDVKITNSQKMDGKGMCIDDASYFICPDKLLQKFPHTEEPIKYVRLFKAFRPDDTEDVTNQARETFVRYVKANNIKVLVGSQITCDETKDTEDWGWVQLLIKALGKDHVLALAVGNELDLLYTQLSEEWVTRECLTRLWGSKEKPGYLYDTTVSRIKWARDTLGSPNLPVTSVLTGSILYSDNAIFPDNRDVMLMTYLNLLFNSGEKNFVFVLNFYPIFDPNLRMDTGGTCDQAMKITACYDDTKCKTIYNGQQGRRLTNSFVRSNSSWGMNKATLWLGEIGWSAPQPATYAGSMAWCAKTVPDADADDPTPENTFFSRHQLYSYYKNFLEWDLSFGANDDPPELVFYFTMRDTTNFGHAEHFGLVPDCSVSYCKVGPHDTAGPALSSPTPVSGTVV